MLAESSSVELFNKGIYELLSKGKELGIIGACEKIWVTAEDEKVCRDCVLMSGKVATFNERFRDYHGNVIGLFPPLHPHCRCVIFYRMLLPPGLDDLTPEAMSTPNTPPYPLGHVDAGDSELISAVLNHYEGRISPQPIENAIVITADGEVYHATGDLNSVDPILGLGSKLNGATVTHNHPKDSEGDYSFSGDDIDLFKNENLDRLRGIDEYFAYELNRNPNDSDFTTPLTTEEMLEMMEKPFDSVHMAVVIKAQIEGWGYRRWRHE
ncbi:MAG: hypothetical protein IJ668_12850 [Selenomonadaceae bacterium]|nr:hypothetical protein [Selenomonadaceae bacterium]